MKKYFSVLIVFATVLISCEPEETQGQKDRNIINQYIADHNLDATEHEYGIYYAIEKPGSGGSPNYTSIVTVKYKGMLPDGRVFDETASGKTATFNLNNLITGWKIAIPLLQKGGKGTFLIPSNLGYGGRSSGIIPAYSVLIFEIELIDFVD